MLALVTVREFDVCKELLRRCFGDEPDMVHGNGFMRTYRVRSPGNEDPVFDEKDAVAVEHTVLNDSPLHPGQAGLVSRH